jgi:hypothetical protein
MSTTTALDIIHGALRLLQVKSPDVALTADEANDALDSLNLMIDSWANESLMLHHITSETFTLTAGLNPHTIGTGGTFNTDRPTDIQAMTVKVGNVDLPVTLLDYDDYAVIKLKTLQNLYPQYAYYEPTYPLGTLWLYPVPSQASSITIYSEKPLTQFANLTSTFSLPPGYAKAMKFNLAVDIAPEYQTEPGQSVVGQAVVTKALIKRKNKKLLTTRADLVLLGNNSATRYNIYRN